MIRNWAPLGYNLRAVRLHEIARQAVQRHGGVSPDTLAGLLALKGIGPYTAGAVACFAFGLPVARALDLRAPASWGASSRRRCQAQAGTTAWPGVWRRRPPAGGRLRLGSGPDGPGATICVARSPRCLLCPVQSLCSARAAWDEQDVPRLLLRESPNGGAPTAPVPASRAPGAGSRGASWTLCGPSPGASLTWRPSGHRSSRMTRRRTGVATGTGAGPRP